MACIFKRPSILRSNDTAPKEKYFHKDSPHNDRVLIFQHMFDILSILICVENFNSYNCSNC